MVTPYQEERLVMKEFPIVCICGSMRFYKTMLLIAERLTFKGFIVLMPFASKDKIEAKNEKEMQYKESMLDRMHLVKIDMTDIVLVVDIDMVDKKGHQDTYIGESTRNEIAYAIARYKYVSRLSLLGEDLIIKV